MACVQIIQALREKSSEIKDNQRQCVCEQAAAQMENKAHRVYASSCLHGPWGLKFHSFFCFLPRPGAWGNQFCPEVTIPTSPESCMENSPQGSR